jgi:hyperosmotically inducible protein
MENRMQTKQWSKTVIFQALLLAGLSMGFGLEMANAADSSTPQSSSSSIRATHRDVLIGRRVMSKLLHQTDLGKTNISVTSSNGRVVLNGTVSSAHAKSMAMSLAESVHGVRNVTNKLIVDANPQPAEKAQAQVIHKAGQVVSDSWITSKVKSEILADSPSKNIAVSVSTVHGVVVLKGELASKAAVNHLKNLTLNVKGVKSVDTSALTILAQ